LVLIVKKLQTKDFAKPVEDGGAKWLREKVNQNLVEAKRMPAIIK
jgi:hypothetical protein